MTLFSAAAMETAHINGLFGNIKANIADPQVCMFHFCVPLGAQNHNFRKKKRKMRHT
jgi:hypothetical protein